VVSAFVNSCGPQQLPQHTLLLFLISLAQAEHGILPSERATLVRIARLMGVDAAQLERLLRMANAQQQFHQQSPQSATSIEDAYAALGVNSSASDTEVKRAYRKRMSENDPDKLIANGVPEEMTRVATEHAQQIQTAYDMIKQTRQALR
jgi:DnaJ like chaperone protein